MFEVVCTSSKIMPPLFTKPQTFLPISKVFFVVQEFFFTAKKFTQRILVPEKQKSGIPEALCFCFRLNQSKLTRKYWKEDDATGF
jgi:hypothetical protein